MKEPDKEPDKVPSVTHKYPTWVKIVAFGMFPTVLVTLVLVIVIPIALRKC